MSKRKQHIERKNETSKNKTTIIKKMDIWIDTKNKVRVEGPRRFHKTRLLDVQGLVQGLGFRVLVWWFKFQGFRFQGLGFLGFRVSGFQDVLDIWESQKGEGRSTKMAKIQCGVKTRLVQEEAQKRPKFIMG